MNVYSRRIDPLYTHILSETGNDTSRVNYDDDALSHVRFQDDKKYFLAVTNFCCMKNLVLPLVQLCLSPVNIPDVKYRSFSNADAVNKRSSLSHHGVVGRSICFSSMLIIKLPQQ